MPRLIATLILLAALAGAFAARTVSAQSREIHAGCPLRFSGLDVRVPTSDGVVAAARHVALAHVVEHNQGRATRRTRTNYPVAEVVDLNGPPVPGQKVLLAQATRRCGELAAASSWAVVFTDTESVLCCTRDVRFVVHLKNGWWVY